MSAVQDHATSSGQEVVLDEKSLEWLDVYAADKNPTKEHQAIVAKALDMARKLRRAK